MCNLEPEFILHTLVLCSFADSCHHFSTTFSIQSSFNSFAEWLQLLFDSKNQYEIHNQVAICWLLWKNRNDAVWKQRSSDVSEVVNSALSSLNQWKSVQDKNYDSFLGFMTSKMVRNSGLPQKLIALRSTSTQLCLKIHLASVLLSLLEIIKVISLKLLQSALLVECLLKLQRLWAFVRRSVGSNAKKFECHSGI